MQRTFSAPGRVEICGNHTDHQCGRVLAAAINLETVCQAEKSGDMLVRIDSRGFDRTEINLRDLSVHEEEKDTTAALVRGVAAWFEQHGYPIGGFNAQVHSDVPGGSGLSSSAAFEVLIGNVFKGLFGSEVTALEIALAGQLAENVYFGKPSGLMDQAASSIGGMTMIDFLDPQKPAVTPIKADLSGYRLCIVATGGSHADLTPDYAAIPTEMAAVARFFGKEYLREVNPADLGGEVGRLYKSGKVNDRAILRAIHFFAEHERVLKQAAALKQNQIAAFLELVTESGRSSIAYLQNIYSPGHPTEQGLSLALALSERLLGKKGAWRVHGGGFAGTVLAFVPAEMQSEYRQQMEAVFGENSCHFLDIRQEGGMEIK